MADVRMATPTRNSIVNDVSALIDASGGGSIEFYTNPRPTTADDAISGATKLADISLAVDSFGAAASGSATANSLPLTDTAADAGGTVTWARILDGAGATIMDVDVGTGSEAITVDNTTVVLGAPFRINTFTLTMPAS